MSAQAKSRMYHFDCASVMSFWDQRMGPLQTQQPAVSANEDENGNALASFVLHGIKEFDGLGSAVSSAGDVSGDGLDDLLLSEYRAEASGDFGAGQSYLVFGRDDGFPLELNLEDLLPANGGDENNNELVGEIQTTITATEVTEVRRRPWGIRRGRNR
ncbi:MAG: hypothetical protein CMJ64_14400 [Planctomycetaceae bacterium]|nr:hypothetical protein [Planctomycetaceae bacterium]